MRIGEHRVRVWLTVVLLVLIGLAAYRIGLNLWGNYHRHAVDAALARREFAQAQSELSKCLWVWPARTELQLLSAQTARRQGNLSDAMRQLRLCQADSALKEAVGLEQCLLQIQKGDLANSEQLDQYGNAFPESKEAMLIEEAQIEGSLAALDVPRARAYLEVWNKRRQSPADRMQGLLWHATACLLAKEVEQAAGCFREAVQLEPAHREAWRREVGPGQGGGRIGNNADHRTFNFTTLRYPINHFSQPSHGLPNFPGNCGTFGICRNSSTNRPLNSAHPGGVNVAMADASVRFVPQTINNQVLGLSGYRDDGIANQLP